MLIDPISHVSTNFNDYKQAEASIKRLKKINLEPIENDNENLNQSNTKEKNVITVDLTNEEKIVFSQLGINPLIKLGKEYLTSNNFVRLKENNDEKEKALDNKKLTAKKGKKVSKSKNLERKRM